MSVWRIHGRDGSHSIRWLHPVVPRRSKLILEEQPDLARCAGKRGLGQACRADSVIAGHDVVLVEEVVDVGARREADFVLEGKLRVGDEPVVALFIARVGSVRKGAVVVDPLEVNRPVVEEPVIRRQRCGDRPGAGETVSGEVNVVAAAALRFPAVLPARRRAARNPDDGDLPRGDPLHADPDRRAIHPGESVNVGLDSHAQNWKPI